MAMALSAVVRIEPDGPGFRSNHQAAGRKREYAYSIGRLPTTEGKKPRSSSSCVSARSRLGIMMN
jgi:hypothetical protein